MNFQFVEHSSCKTNSGFIPQIIFQMPWSPTGGWSKCDESDYFFMWSFFRSQIVISGSHVMWPKHDQKSEQYFWKTKARNLKILALKYQWLSAKNSFICSSNLGLKVKSYTVHCTQYMDILNLNRVTEWRANYINGDKTILVRQLTTDWIIWLTIHFNDDTKHSKVANHICYLWCVLTNHIKSTYNAKLIVILSCGWDLGNIIHDSQHVHKIRPSLFDL